MKHTLILTLFLTLLASPSLKEYKTTTTTRYKKSSNNLVLCDVKIFLTYLDGVRKTLKWKFRCSSHKWAYIYVPRAYMLRPTEKYFRTSIYVYHQSVYTAECILHIHISWVGTSIEIKNTA